MQIDFELVGEVLPSLKTVEVSERFGCDAAPIDLATSEGRLSLLAYIWPDQQLRLERIRAALTFADRVPVCVDRESAAAWIARKLAATTPGEATVLYHSIVAQYLGEKELTAFYVNLHRAAERASADAPLAWLRMEPAGKLADLHLTTWPGGEDRHLARVGYHGSPVELIPALSSA